MLNLLSVRKITRDKWFELYATDNTPDLKCTTVEFMTKDSSVTVHHEGKIDETNNVTSHIMGNRTTRFNALYYISRESKFHITFNHYNVNFYGIQMLYSII